MSQEPMIESHTGRQGLNGVSPDISIGEQDESAIDLIALLNTFLEARKTIGWIAATVFVLVAAIAFLLPAQYTSVAAFIPPSTGGSSSMASALAGQLSLLGAGDLLGGIKNSGDLYAGILRSRSIADKLIHDEDLEKVYRVKRTSEAEKDLAAATSIGIDAKSSIVTVSVTDHDPTRAQRLNNGYMKALKETQGRLALTEAAQRAMFFGQQLAKEKDALELSLIHISEPTRQA